MYESASVPQPAGGPAPTHRLVRRILTGAAAAFVGVLSFSLIGVGTASAATPAALTGGHAVSPDHHGGGGGTWDQTKVPLPHQPGQAPVFVLQSRTVADVEALDQTSGAAADASMLAFYANNTACIVTKPLGPGDITFKVTCPHGTATVTDTAPIFAGAWVHVFRLVH